MIYDIGLTIAYEYDRPAVAGRHILRLLPADLPGVQRRITGLLTILPEPAERRPFIDFFGNSGVEVAFRAEHDEILFRVAVPGRAHRPRPPSSTSRPTSPASPPRSPTTAASTPTPRTTSSAPARAWRPAPR